MTRPTRVPKPPRIDPVRWRPPPVDPLPPPDRSGPLTVVDVPGHAPEDVVVDADGAIWTGVDDGRIVKIAADGSVSVVADTGGRPLGLCVARDGTLLVCDSHLGLLRLDTGTAEFEVLVADDGGRALTFCSNAVESSDGTIYFTESTDRFGYEYYKGAALEARGSGHLFRRDPDGSVHELLGGLYFANGVTLTLDESALVFAETVGRRLSKYWLRGPRAGTVTPLIQHLPGMPDNISTGADGRIWVAMVADRNPISEWLSPRAPVLRKALWRLPYTWLPALKPVVWVLAVDADGGAVVSQLRTTHPDFALATGLVEAAGRLWIGGIGSSAVAHTPLW